MDPRAHFWLIVTERRHERDAVARERLLGAARRAGSRHRRGALPRAGARAIVARLVDVVRLAVGIRPDPA